MSEPNAWRQEYRRYAAEAGRLLHAEEEARRKLAEAEERRTTAYGTVEEEWARLDALDERAAGIWKEVTVRFGDRMAGPVPEPDPRADPSGDAEELLREAHRLAREPVHHALTGLYVRMALLGFLSAVAVAIAGLLAARGLADLGQTRLVFVFGPVLAAPWIGYAAASAWIRTRTSHEEREYAVDTARAGIGGGAGVWLIAVVFVVVHLVS